MRKLVAAVLIVTVVAGFISNTAYAHHKGDHGDSPTGAKPGHSNPDENGNGPERDGGPADPAGEMAPHANNGCGNDDDRIDDNEGWCGRKPKITPPPASTPVPTSTPAPPPPSSTPVPTSTPGPPPPASTPEPPIITKQPPVEHTPPGILEDWEDVRIDVCPPVLMQPQQTRVITVYIRLPAHADVASEAGNYELVAMLGGLMVVGYVAKRRTS